MVTVRLRLGGSTSRGSTSSRASSPKLTYPTALTPLQSQLEESPQTPPPCIFCHRPTSKHVTRHSNRNGNGGRPYAKCIPCGKFHCFMDERGNDPTNRPCHCGEASKTQVSGSGRGRFVHYVCRLGACDFYAPHVTDTGDLLGLTEDLVVSLGRLALV